MDCLRNRRFVQDGHTATGRGASDTQGTGQIARDSGRGMDRAIQRPLQRTNKGVLVRYLRGAGNSLGGRRDRAGARALGRGVRATRRVSAQLRPAPEESRGGVRPRRGSRSTRPVPCTPDRPTTAIPAKCGWKREKRSSGSTFGAAPTTRSRCPTAD
ncbi:unnamed protein product [Trichogramma brassicae]|uniref:Uncharacterized protein n=1 Tax=Trichogramma brassicae TaxID=86971 RepID=A0A6H5HYG1_9HYME|nr:unnamed protein product [Trichogramma brassicae]